MNALAVVLQEPEHLSLSRLDLSAPGDADVVVDVAWSGISTGTEKLLWSGRMPHFPGMGYPLVPGYESVGRVSHAGRDSGLREGDAVFVPGSNCFGAVRGLFGGAAQQLVVPGARAMPLGAELGERLGEQGVLFALAATAHHVSSSAQPHSTEPLAGPQPELIIGHGVLGRLLARLAVAAGTQPVVWETNPQRREGAQGYEVIDPADDAHRTHTRTYTRICDVSGDATLLDRLIARLAPGGEVVLAGFYEAPLSFAFPPAFMREARIRVAAQWQPTDLAAVRELVASGRLSLDGLITHRSDARQADSAYRTAFGDPSCLKMILDWRSTP